MARVVRPSSNLSDQYFALPVNRRGFFCPISYKAILKRYNTCDKFFNFVNWYHIGIVLFIEFGPFYDIWYASTKKAMNTTLSSLLSKVQFCPPVASTGFYELLIQFALNLAVILLISLALYYKWNRKAEYVFAQIITGIIVFIICAMLRFVQLELGLVLGLFAIFAIIRFRTINVEVKDMAYLFMIVGISAVNALLKITDCIQWIVFANLLLIVTTWLLEKTFFSNRLSQRTITFSDTAMLKPSQHTMLLARLKELTELNIIRFEIGKTDYIKNNAQIKIFFKGDESTGFGSTDDNNDDD